LFTATSISGTSIVIIAVYIIVYTPFFFGTVVISTSIAVIAFMFCVFTTSFWFAAVIGTSIIIVTVNSFIITLSSRTFFGGTLVFIITVMWGMYASSR